jgi:hypothetical protein
MAVVNYTYLLEDHDRRVENRPQLARSVNVDQASECVGEIERGERLTCRGATKSRGEPHNAMETDTLTYPCEETYLDRSILVIVSYESTRSNTTVHKRRREYHRVGVCMCVCVD